MQKTFDIVGAVAALIASYADFRRNNPAAPYWWNTVGRGVKLTAWQLDFLDGIGRHVDALVEGRTAHFRDGLLLMLDLCDAGEAKQGGCTMRLVDGFYVFTLDRDPSVSHRIKADCTCPERLAAHWEGFRLHKQPKDASFSNAA